MNKTVGFTLIELLVVVLIVSILAAIAFPLYQKAVEKAHAMEAIAMLKTMHDKGILCELEKGFAACHSMTNNELNIHFGDDFRCEYLDYTEFCCNKNWCYANNGIDWGDGCGSPTGPKARRVHGIPANVWDLGDDDFDYELGYGDCPTSAYPGKIVCRYGKQCDMFHGDGQPIN